MLREVRLHGTLGVFGRSHMLSVDSVSEAVRALCVKRPGFRQTLVKGDYHIIWKNEHTYGIATDGLNMKLGQEGTIHIVPALAGSKSIGGLITAIAGAVLVATAFFLAPAALAGSGAFLGADWGATALSLGGLGSITFGNIATVGLAMILLGAGAMLAPKPPSLDTGAGNAPPDGGSLFASPQNVSVQGLAVPLVYGKFLVGSIIISSGISNATVPPASDFSLESSILGAGVCNCPIPNPADMTRLNIVNPAANFRQGQSGLLTNGYLYVPGNLGATSPGTVPIARVNTTSLVTEWLQLDPGYATGNGTNISSEPVTDGTYIYVLMPRFDVSFGSDGLTVARIHSDFNTVDYAFLTESGVAWSGPPKKLAIANGYLYIQGWTLGTSNFLYRLNLSDFSTFESVNLTADLNIRDEGQSNTIYSSGNRVFQGTFKNITTGTHYILEYDTALPFDTANFVLHDMSAVTSFLGTLNGIQGDFLYWSTVGFGVESVVKTRLNDFTDNTVIGPGFYADSLYYDGTRYLWGSTGQEVWRLDTVNSYTKETVNMHDASTNGDDLVPVAGTGIWKDGLKMFIVARALGPDEVPNNDDSPVFTFSTCS